MWSSTLKVISTDMKTHENSHIKKFKGLHKRNRENVFIYLSLAMYSIS